MSDIVKVNWSGGKNSTCSMLLHLQCGDMVKGVCYIPMFTEKIPLLDKIHYDFIKETAYYFENRGAEIYFANGLTYVDYVTHIAKKGKNKGKIFGFPYIGAGMCGFKRDSKLKALREIDVGYYDYEDIGIAYDEIKRHGQLTEQKRSILCEFKYTDLKCAHACALHGILSPKYRYENRDGCVLCPNAKDKEIIRWLSDYPEAAPILAELEDKVKRERPDLLPPRRNYKWFMEVV